MKEARKRAREEKVVKKILITNDASLDTNVNNDKVEKVE